MFANHQRRQRGFRRLYLQIYLTVVVSLALVVAAAGVIFRLAMDSAPPPPVAWLAFLLVGALAVALAAWPLVRRLTRRLERLQ